MLEAKDTVIIKSPPDFKEFTGTFKEWVQNIRLSQAEISFKAGIKEVVEWMRQIRDLSYEGAKNYANEGLQNSDGYRLLGLTGQAYGIVLERLEVKLKELGI